jgi:F-type H+-transporting ATPase subunit gamma
MMSDNIELAKARLENIKSIEPLLGALRTMSMGAWQSALNKITQTEEFEKNFDRILYEILPYIENKGKSKPKVSSSSHSGSKTILLILGSERGLIGKFNKTLIDNLLEWLNEQDLQSYRVWVLGSRLLRDLKQHSIKVDWFAKLPASNLSSYRDAYLMTQDWLQQYELYNFDQLIIAYNKVRNGSFYEFSTQRLLPYQPMNTTEDLEKREQLWPPPIIETAPEGIYRQILQHFIASRFYQNLLKSAAAEHAARFRLMEEAKNNAEEIIKELNIDINVQRKKKITQEMQELSSGAGLVGQ